MAPSAVFGLIDEMVRLFPTNLYDDSSHAYKFGERVGGNARANPDARFVR